MGLYRYWKQEHPKSIAIVVASTFLIASINSQKDNDPCDVLYTQGQAHSSIYDEINKHHKKVNLPRLQQSIKPSRERLCSDYSESNAA